MSASPEGRSDGKDPVTTALFGPIIQSVEYQQSVEDGDVVPIEYYMAKYSDEPLAFKRDIDKSRFGYWQNHGRNERCREVYDQLFTENDQVLIIVDKTEHMLYLAQHFPEAALVYDSMSKPQFAKFVAQGLVNADDYKHWKKCDKAYWASRFKQDLVRVAIATKVWKEGIDFQKLYGVIRMDGTTGPIHATQIGGRLSRKGTDKGILVDFEDDYGNRDSIAVRPKRDRISP